MLSIGGAPRFLLNAWETPYCTTAMSKNLLCGAIYAPPEYFTRLLIFSNLIDANVMLFYLLTKNKLDEWNSCQIGTVFINGR